MLTAAVIAVEPSGATPTGGTVTFVDQTTSTILGSATLTGGTAAITVASLAAGSHTIITTYSGDGASFSGSDGSTTVNPTSIIMTVAGDGSYSYLYLGLGDGGQATAASLVLGGDRCGQQRPPVHYRRSQPSPGG